MSDENEASATVTEVPQPYVAGPFVPPTMGRIVRFVMAQTETLANGESWHPHAPAIIVSCTGRPNHAVNLNVFVEATKARPLADDTMAVPYDAECSPGTWHYPPRF